MDEKQNQGPASSNASFDSVESRRASQNGPASTGSSGLGGQNPVGQTPTNPTNGAQNSQNSANTPNYPTDDLSKGEPSNRPGIRTVLRTVMVILIVAAAVWFFSRGDGKKPAGNVLSESENTNVEQTNTNNVNEAQNINTVVVDGASNIEEKVQITAFFAKNGDAECNRVYSLTREIGKKYTEETVNAIRGLLTPLSAEEMKNGIVTRIPTSVYLNSIFVGGDGVATIKFNSAMNQTMDDCTKQTVRAQIEQTMLQFPYVKAVKICAGDICE